MDTRDHRCDMFVAFLTKFEYTLPVFKYFLVEIRFENL